MNHVADNLSRIRDAIAAAASSAGRRPEHIKLIAVSKTHSADLIGEAYRAGQRVFGENIVQEAIAKIPSLAGHDIEWHFIGRLQSNKAKFIPGNFSWVHSLDSVKLAQRLSRLSEEQANKINALIEVNIMGDPKKHGVLPDALLRLVEELLNDDLPALALRGLMAIGPQHASEGERRAAFARVRMLCDDCQRRFGLTAFNEISVGMSGDFVEAIKEGATMVRIGTAIFGNRT